MKKTNIQLPPDGKQPQRRFERFVSALLRVPKKELDEKQRELEAKKGLPEGL